MMYRVYPTIRTANIALNKVNDNLRVGAVNNGYVVIDGVIIGKSDGKNRLSATGTRSYQDAIQEIPNNGWGFIDPATLCPEWPFLMNDVEVGEVIEYYFPEE